MTKPQIEAEIAAAQAKIKGLRDKADKTWSAWHGAASAPSGKRWNSGSTASTHRATKNSIAPSVRMSKSRGGAPDAPV